MGWILLSEMRLWTRLGWVGIGGTFGATREGEVCGHVNRRCQQGKRGECPTVGGES